MKWGTLIFNHIVQIIFHKRNMSHEIQLASLTELPMKKKRFYTLGSKAPSKSNQDLADRIIQ